MHLRRAKDTDYSILKELYEDIYMQCLFNPQYPPELPPEGSPIYKFMQELESMSDEQSQEIEAKLSLGTFKKLQKNFLVIETESNNICGYYFIDYSKRGIWRVEEWGGYDCKANKKEMLRALISYWKKIGRKTKPQLMIAPLYDEDKRMLESEGFDKGEYWGYYKKYSD